jgi:hypothetical protein
MVRNALQHLAQIRLRVEAIQFRGANQAVDGGLTGLLSVFLLGAVIGLFSAYFFPIKDC